MSAEPAKPAYASSPNRRLVQKVAALRAYLDELDEQTRLPGEPPLREAVAEQARQRLAEMDAPEPCCVGGPTGHTQQQHHDASPCYDQACPFDHPHGGPFPHPCDGAS